MKRFKKVYIEITNQCNLCCDFCPLTTRPAEYMTLEAFEKILTEVKPYTEHLYFHVMGEPLLHPLLEAFLTLAGAQGFKVNLTTNGTLLAEKQAILLKAAALRQINISLTSFEANDQPLLADVSESLHLSPLKTYLKEVLAFVLAANQTTKIISSLRLWNMDTDTLKGANQRNAEIFKTIEETLGFENSLAEALAQKPSCKIRDRVYVNMAEKFEWPDIHKEETHEQLFCHGLRDQIGILTNGTVVPCCLDGEGVIDLGNVLNTPLLEILESQRAKAIYDGFSCRKAVEPLCQRCGYAERY